MQDDKPKRQEGTAVAMANHTSPVPARRVERLLQAKLDLPTRRGHTSLCRSPIEHAELLQALGAVALRHGNPLRGLALIYVAHQLVPNDDKIATCLAHAYLVNGEPELALKTLNNLKGLHNDQQRWAIAYLRAKSLLATGQLREAQDVFARSVAPLIGAKP